MREAWLRNRPRYSVSKEQYQPGISKCQLASSAQVKNSENQQQIYFLTRSLSHSSSSQFFPDIKFCVVPPPSKRLVEKFGYAATLLRCYPDAKPCSQETPMQLQDDLNSKEENQHGKDHRLHLRTLGGFCQLSSTPNLILEGVQKVIVGKN